MSDRTLKRLWRAAAYGKDKQLVRLLARHPHLLDAHISCGMTLMHIAVDEGQASIVKILIQLGCSTIDKYASGGWTPMYGAARSGSASIVEMLLLAGSKTIDAPVEGGATPTDAAAEYGHASLVKTFIRLGCRLVDIPGYGNLRLGITSEARESVAKTLWYLGARLTDEWDYTFKVYDEDAAAEVRREVHFSWSLLDRCLFKVERRNTPQIRI